MSKLCNNHYLRLKSGNFKIEISNFAPSKQQNHRGQGYNYKQCMSATDRSA